MALSAEPQVNTRTDNRRAAGMGLAVAGGNAISLLFTVVFARLLGAPDYASLASLTSAFFIASIPGTAAQMAVARGVSAAAASGRDRELAQNVRRWTGLAVLGSVILLLLSVLLRAPLAELFGVQQEWAAALVFPSAGMWLVASLQRGALQGLQDYRVVGGSVVGEAVGRLVFGLALVGAGLGVAGAVGGLTAALVVVAIVLDRRLRNRGCGASLGAAPHETWRTLRSSLRETGAPVVAIGLLAVLQNVDVIVVKHTAPARAAGAYAAASFSAKGLVWVAVGLGMYLLPEASRRFHAGDDPRPLFLSTLGLLAAAIAPALVLFGVAGRPLLEGLFGKAFGSGDDVLLLLGAAMGALAFTYLSVQYLIALRHARFLWLLGAAAIVEPVVLVAFGDDLVGLAAALLVLQCLLALSLLALDARRPPRMMPSASGSVARAVEIHQ